MRTTMRSRLVLLFMTFVLLVATPAIAFAQEAGDSGDTSAPAPTIHSDQDDYPPGATVTLSGSNWQPGESVNVLVNDDEGQTWSRDVDVTADANGQIQDRFQLPDWFVATYKVRATGAQSGVATTSFTDARVVASATLNGGNSVNVKPADAVTAKVDVRTDGTGANARWRSTGWRIAATAPNATSDVICVNHADYDSAGTYSETFSINAPSASGTYNAYFIAFSDNGCTWSSPGSGTSQSTTFTLSNGVVVESPTRATTTSVARTAGPSPSTYGQPVTFTSTVTATGGNPNGAGSVTFKDGTDAISGCSNVPLSGNTATCTTSALSAAASPHSITAHYSGATAGSTTFGASTSPALTQSVNKATPTVSITWSNAIYDGSVNSASATVSGIGDPPENLGSAGLTYYTGSTAAGTPLSGAPRDAGTYTVQASFGGNANYNAASNTKTITVAPKPVSGSFTASSKIYDGNTDATIATRSLQGVVNGDAVSLAGGAASFDNKNVGTGKTVSGTGFTLAGAKASNYNLESSNLSTTADITRKPLTGSFTAKDKIYDGNTDATITGYTLNGKIEGDQVRLDVDAAQFDNKNVGTGKTVTVATSDLAGPDAGNYSLAGRSWTTTANITVRPITVTADSGQSKVYGENDPALTYGITSGNLVADDSLSGALSRAAGEDVGPYAIEQGSLSASNNYDLTFVGASFTIDKRSITVTADPQTKVYGAADPELTYRITNNTSLANGDGFSGSLTRETGESVANSPYGIQQGTLSLGDDAGNYNLTFNGANLTITRKPLTGSFTAQDKVYDGTADATIASSNLEGVVGDDDVRLDGDEASFADKNVGQNKTVTVNRGSLSGNDAGNYTLANGPWEATANITPRSVSGSFTASDKVYDGNTNAQITGRSLNNSDVITNDDVGLSGGSATFADKNVGQNKSVSGTGFTLVGADRDNYSLDSVADTTASITAKELIGGFTAEDKVYDGNANATVTANPLQDVLDGETVNLIVSNAHFDDENTGQNKTVTADLALSGADASNYALKSTTSTDTADVTPRELIGSFTASDKVYDGDDSATIATRDLSGKVNGDDVSLGGGSASFTNKDVGTDKTVTATGFTLIGADKNNYSLKAGPWEATASITARPITVTADPQTKVYGEDDPDLTYDITNGLLVQGESLDGELTREAGESVADSPYAIQQGTLSASANYDLTFNGANLTITRKPLTGSFTAQDKVYDGNTDAEVDGKSLPGVLDGDQVTLQVTNARFGDKNVGTGKTVSAELALSGSQAANYSLISPAAFTTADITEKAITGTFTAPNKVYDGTAAATITGRSLQGVIEDDTVNLTGGTASFDDENVGTGKTVTGSGFVLSGTDARNYVLDPTTLTTSADITKRPITITTDAKSKVYGAADPELTYRITNNTSLANGDGFSGKLEREAGEDVGTYAIKQGTLSLGDDAGNYDLTFNGANLTITVANTTTTVTVTPGSPQYSDLATLTATVNGPNTPTGSIQFKIDGVNVGSPQTLSGGSASLPDHQLLQAPGAHSVSAVFTSNSTNWSGSTSSPTPLPVKQENAKAEFSGQTFYAVPSGSATVTLSAVITDDADGSRGDIRNAKVTFVNRDTGATLCTANVGLITTGDTTAGAATCNVSLGYGSTGSTQYTVGIKVGGHYVDDNSAENTVVTVSQATSSMITGGGYLMNSNSGGQYAGDKGQKTNFGFNVKYNKSNTNLQGNINTIVRRGDRVYQIKGNSMTSLTTALATATRPGTATFNGKASIQDITNPSAPIPVDGNASLQVTMTDRGEPGKDDSIGITVWNKNGGLWFSSNWVSPKTVEQVLGGGNVVVR